MLPVPVLLTGAFKFFAKDKPVFRCFCQLALQTALDISADPILENFMPSTKEKSLNMTVKEMKSEKRKASEALLATRFRASGTNLLQNLHQSFSWEATAEQASPAKRRKGSPSNSSVSVPACEEGVGELSWKSFPCSMPQFVTDQGHPLRPVPGTGNSSFQFETEGLNVILVERSDALPAALGKLRQSMEDRVISIDLEWRPDFRPGCFSKVALMQVFQWIFHISTDHCIFLYVLVDSGALKLMFLE